MSKELGAGGRFDIFLDSAQGVCQIREVLFPDISLIFTLSTRVDVVHEQIIHTTLITIQDYINKPQPT